MPTKAPASAPDAPVPTLADFLTFNDFADRFEKQGLGTKYTLRWLLRYRTQNGLASSGAIVELKTPGATRCRLLVNAPKFAAWLAAQSCAQAA